MFVLNSDLTEKLIEAMGWELETRRYCEKLIEYAKTDEDMENIFDIIENERRHYCILNELYIYLTDKKAEVRHSRRIEFEGYVKGIEIVIGSIKRIYSLYREVQIRNKSPYIRSIFSNLAEDEREHVTILNHLYAKAVWL